MSHATSNDQPCPECDDRLTYLCHWCHRRSLKGQWGPGWIRCPLCARVAPTPAELVTYDPPKVTVVGNLRDLLAFVPDPERDR